MTECSLLFVDMLGAPDLFQLVSFFVIVCFLVDLHIIFVLFLMWSLTNLWCSTIAVPPAYYAHLAAFRARFYMEPETSDSGSMTSGAVAGRGMGGVGRSTRVPGANAAVRPLPALKENVKRVMFYC